MKADQQPFFHPRSTLSQKAIASVYFTFNAALFSVLPYSGIATAKAAFQALDFYQRNAVDLGALRRERDRRDPCSALFRLIAATNRQRAALEYALSFEFKSQGWYGRAARRTYGTIAVLFFGLTYISRSNSLLQITLIAGERRIRVRASRTVRKSC